MSIAANKFVVVVGVKEGVTVVGETVGETVGESVGETAAGVENTDGTPVIPTTLKGPHPPNKPPPKVTTFEE